MTRIPGFLDHIAAALGDSAPAAFSVTGAGGLPSVFAVSDLATATIGAAGTEIARLSAQASGSMPTLTVDRRQASFWYDLTFKPLGWEIAGLWDSIAGDYPTRDGWIRLHTNARHHRAAAQRVLGPHDDRTAMARAVAGWTARDLEDAVVGEKGCAAEMRSIEAWAAHPQGKSVQTEPLIHLDWTPGAPDSRAVDPARPLDGLKVLDCTRVLAGPAAGRFLAGFGADVLRIDPPWWEEPLLAPDMTLGKRCAGLDLREAADRDTFGRLLAEADLFLHGYRSDALEGMGFGFAARRTLNPQLIGISLDAYGWSGPWRTRRAFDSLIQMSSGIAHAGMVRRRADKPVPLPVQALDHATGYLLAVAAARGVFERRESGRILRARASLARTAKLVVDNDPEVLDDPLAERSDADFWETPETTGSGPALRLRPPLVVEGCPMRFDRPASNLRTAAPGWRG
jgi:hypothetical protein